MASIEFERAIFYETDNNKISKYRYYKALCYKGLGETKKALDELNEINITRLSDSLFFMIRYEQALCNFLNNDPNRSLWNIDDVRARIPDSLKTIDIIPLNILCLNSLRKWNDAISLWNYLIDNSSLEDSARLAVKDEIKSLYSRRKIPKYMSPDKAEILSRFVPGLGQIYTGELFEGSFNFLMNTAILGFSLYEFYTKFYFTGYMVGLTILNKTYHSGMHRANLLASEKTQTSLNKFNISATSIMMKVLDSDPSRKMKVLGSLTKE